LDARGGRAVRDGARPAPCLTPRYRPFGRWSTPRRLSRFVLRPTTDGSTAMTTLISPLRRAVQVGAENTAVTCGEVQLTYRETWERCGRLVAALRRLGVGAGDRVAIVGPNSHRYLECYQAVPGAGMVIVPLNARHSAAEL